MGKSKQFLKFVKQAGFSCLIDRERKFKIVDNQGKPLCYGFFTEEDKVLFTYISNSNLVSKAFGKGILHEFITSENEPVIFNPPKRENIFYRTLLPVALVIIDAISSYAILFDLLKTNAHKKSKRIKLKFLASFIPKSCRDEAIKDIEDVISEMRRENQPKIYVVFVVILHLASIIWHGVWFKLSGYFYPEKEQSSDN
ncbi:hypothetical protein [uncultured Croceitalea sp.]|uniref:hypothetical protein n=1 Tax=uncultured Croceitalea sp. TaxID=1798908 RepID=UPI00374FD16B